MITNLTDVTGGNVFFLGQDITNAKGRVLLESYRKMQMVFQMPAESFDPRRTLGDGIGESLCNKGISRAQTKKKVKELLVTCGLTEDFAKRYPHEVSGGQCQRAAIARHWR
jgi:peptide/nickel transport system ATP-binding protein